MIEGISVFYSLLFSVFALKANRGTSIGILFASVLLWPEYLRFPFLGIQMSAPRLVALFLFLKFYKNKKAKDRHNRIDALIVFSYVWGVFANVMNEGDMAKITMLIGRVFDTVIPYFAARYAIREKSDLQDMISPLVVVAIIMGLAGMMEAITYYSPYQQLIDFHKWIWIVKPVEYRLGFLRAQGSTAHPIYFGMCMFILTGLLLSLRGVVTETKLYKKSKWKWKLAVIVAVLGTLSSMSSGPIISVVFLLGSNILYYKRQVIKPIIWFIAILLVCIELLSNRHFYQLIDYIALRSTTAYYRTRLIEVAIQQLYEYWLFGFGDKSPSHWGKMIDGRKHVDLVNNYVVAAFYSGVIGAVTLFYIQVLIIKQSFILWKNSDFGIKIFAFSKACFIFSYMLSSMSVGIFGPVLICSYIVYGIFSSSIYIDKNY